MQRPGTPETLNTTLNNAGILADRKIPLAIVSGYESYVPKTRVPLYEAAIAMVNGLGYDRALKAITIDAPESSRSMPTTAASSRERWLTSYSMMATRLSTRLT